MRCLQRTINRLAPGRTFLARTAPHDSIFSLDLNATFDRLDKLNYNTCWARRTFASAT